MGVHVSNKGIKTANCGLYRDVFHVNIGAAGAVGTLYQAGANFVSSVVHTGAGVYTVNLNKLYPVRVITVFASVASPAVTDDSRWCRYKAGSYNATAGTFVVHVSDPDDDSATDPLENSEIHVCIDYVAMTTGIAH